MERKKQRQIDTGIDISLDLDIDIEMDRYWQFRQIDGQTDRQIGREREREGDATALCGTTLTYIMQCTVMQYNAMSRPVLYCTVLLCHLMSRYCDVMLCHVNVSHFMSHHVTFCCLNLISCNVDGQRDIQLWVD